MWTKLGFGRHEDKILPQLVFSDPDYFFWAYEKRVFIDKGSLEQEAEKIFERATQIRIPPKGGERRVAEYVLYSPDGTFGVLQLVPVSQARHEGSPALRFDVIDLRIVRQIKKYDKGGGKRLIRTVKFHLFGSETVRLTAKRCASFFEYDRNFVLSSQPAPRSEVLQPKWICEECREPIKGIEDGCVEWIRSDGVDSGFRLVHYRHASPNGNCYRYRRQAGRRNLSLRDFLEDPRSMDQISPQHREKLFQKLGGRWFRLASWVAQQSR
jgi:hypothetical protein